MLHLNIKVTEIKGKNKPIMLKIIKIKDHAVKSFKAIYWALFLLLFTGCLIGCSSSSGGDDNDKGQIPKISDVKLFNANTPGNSTSAFNDGDNLQYQVSAFDEDLDLKELSITLYLKKNNVLFGGPYIIPAPTQEEETMVIESDPISLAGLAGEYRIEFEVTDDAGNASLAFLRSLYISLTTFVSNKSNTVTDTRVDIKWQNSSILSKQTRAEALVYCDTLLLDGNGDWRLPEDSILQTLWEETDDPPYINEIFNAIPDSYWSTTETEDGYAGYVVDFGSNSTAEPVESLKETQHYVRCVRSDGLDDDGDGFSEEQGDCNDDDKTAFPGGVEICSDGIDQDCNGKDSDCNDLDDDMDGYTENDGDCDDTNADINPGAKETCGDAIDQDCTGKDLDCNDVDDDNDGFTENDGDCDDTNADINADAKEICGDSIDQDCNGSDLSCDNVDGDGDGFTDKQGDCDDTMAGVYPGAQEIMGDGIDQDCNGSDLLGPLDTDDDHDGFTENQNDCNDRNVAVNPDAKEICGDGIDQDCNGSDLTCSTNPAQNVDDDADGYTETQGDCNDADPTIYPGKTEICGDTIDQDCDGSDEVCTEDPKTIDDDGDGVTEEQGDCDDTNPDINPNATETCGDGIDQDCAGGDLACTETPAPVPPVVSGDKDGDGHTTDQGDCDDNDATIYPGAYEIPGDRIDQDCNASPFTD